MRHSTTLDQQRTPGDLSDDLAAATGLDTATRERVRDTLSARPRGLFSDVDGTLSPIAPSPESATLLPGVADLLDRARQSFDLVAAVSGRSARDTRRMVGLGTITYLGNHGFERLDPSTTGREIIHIHPAARPYEADIIRLLARIEAILAPRYPGLRIEPKGVTASIHVRNAENPPAAEAAVMQLAQSLAAPLHLRVTRGRRVVELRPPIAANKGSAVAELIRARRLRAAVYLGDDQTDVDAFRALRRLAAAGICRAISVAVLHDEAPALLAAEADLTLASIQRVPAFLRWLLNALDA